MSKTRKSGRGSATRGWKRQQPGYHQRTVMLKKCGKKCFLGPKKSYPICTKNTCKLNPKGIYSAFIRASQYHKKNISRKANNLLIKMGMKR
jgi:hypothetical protein